MAVNLLGRHEFPEQIRFPGGKLVDKVLGADVLWRGDLLLGWEGDDIHLYADFRKQTWELVRWCPDGTYKSILRTAFALAGEAQVVDLMLRWLLSHDTQRGFDPIADIDKHNAARDTAADKAHSELIVEEVAPRLKHALHKDGIIEKQTWGQTGFGGPKAAP